MASEKQQQAAQKNIRKAQRKWQSMSSRQRAIAQPEGRDRAKPGTQGDGDYYRIIIRPKSDFTSFRTHDVGRDGHTQRLSGRRSSGSWATHAWLIHKADAEVDDQGYLRGKTDGVKKVLRNLRTVPRRTRGDLFKSNPRENVPEQKKPTRAQQRARQENIKKARRARTG
ncbi:MAG: hypothetical protein ACE37N_16440 [Pseudohongiellaceae bacterium]|jgi:hypothetical protein